MVQISCIVGFQGNCSSSTKSAVASFKPEKAATETGGCSAPYTVVSNRFRLQLQTHCQTVAVMVFILCDLCGESLQGVFL